MLNKKIILVIVISFVFTIGFNFNTLAVTCPDTVNWDNSTGVCIPINTGLPQGATTDPIIAVAEAVMLWLLRIVGIIAVIAFVVSGIQYLTSAGSESQIETAKRNMKWSIVGVIVALMGLIILNFVDDMLNGNLSGRGIGSGGGGGGGNSVTTPGTNPSGTWINPDTGLPYNNNNTTSASRGENIVNSAINNSATTVPNSPVNNTDLPIVN